MAAELQKLILYKCWNFWKGSCKAVSFSQPGEWFTLWLVSETKPAQVSIYLSYSQISLNVQP